MKRILITGAAGQIGRALRKAWRGKYKLRLTDIAPMESPGFKCAQLILASLLTNKKNSKENKNHKDKC